MNTNDQRRLFLKMSFIAGTIGLLSPQRILAQWNSLAFASDNITDAINNGMGNSNINISGNVKIELAKIAENGATVPVTVEANLPSVQSIAILAEKNPRPLCGIFYPAEGIRPKVQMRIKMAESSDIIAVVKSQQKLYMAKKFIKVAKGGCNS